MKFTFAPEARPLDGYTIKRAIHRGGFGEVYYALSDAGKEVALKLLNNNLDVELRGVSQCLNLKHPNLVTIFDIRTDAENDHWVIMEYVSGRGLYETLQGHPDGLPLDEVLIWLHGIAAGLGFLHDRGIVHRDLKPANVFRDHSAVKIGDVGLSKYISESRRSAQTQSVGTVYYMAPEVARGRYGREVDVYALGVMLYEMLTGNVPFDGQTTAEILMKHLTAEPDLSVLPAPLRPVIAAALEKDPDKRTCSAEELEREFRNAVAGADVRAPVPLTRPATTVEIPAATLSGVPPQTQEPAAKPAPERRAPRPAPVSGLAALAAFWNGLPTPLQWVAGGATALLVIESGLLRPVAVGGMIGGAGYLAYQIIQALVGTRFPERSDSPTDNRASSAPPPPQPRADRRPPARHAPRAGRQVRVYTPATLRKISKTQRATDLSTSVSVSLAAAALVTIAVFLTTDLLRDASQAVYFGAVTMLAAWGLIVPSKLWEGRPGDSFTRRLCLGTVGLGVGFSAAVLPQYLLIDRELLFRGSPGVAPYTLGRVVISDGSGFPTTASFMIFFAALFAVRRWWWQVDSFRTSRFRVSSALLTLLVGVMITGILQQFSFPDALGATWALAISAVVQLSAGWTPAEARTLTPVRPGLEPPPRTPDPGPSLAGRNAASLKNA
ncbi:MAG: protein kinase [Fuerstiella sp.]